MPRLRWRPPPNPPPSHVGEPSPWRTICDKVVVRPGRSPSGIVMHATTRSCLASGVELRVGQDGPPLPPGPAALCLRYAARDAISDSVGRHFHLAGNESEGEDGPAAAVTCGHCLALQSKAKTNDLLRHLVGCVGVAPVVRDVEKALVRAVGIQNDDGP
jgi:hypothetical protein